MFVFLEEFNHILPGVKGVELSHGGAGDEDTHRKFSVVCFCAG